MDTDKSDVGAQQVSLPRAGAFLLFFLSWSFRAAK